MTLIPGRDFVAQFKSRCSNQQIGKGQMNTL